MPVCYHPDGADKYIAVEAAMKRTIAALCAFALIATLACKKKDGEKPGSAEFPKKYAMYQSGVYKDKELKEWLATLEKAESVQMLGEEKYLNRKNVQLDLLKIKLADDKEGYIEAKHLADRPIVFIDDNIRAFVRPDTGSKVFATIPRGTIAFITDEKAAWVKVYVGIMDGKWLTGHWVKGGYSADEQMVVEAKEYEGACALLKETKPEKMEKAMKAAREKFDELAKGSSMIAELAKIKLQELDGASAPEVKKQSAGDVPVNEEPGVKTEQ
jgi:lipoprotein LenA